MIDIKVKGKITNDNKGLYYSIDPRFKPEEMGDTKDFTLVTDPE
jgi:hypothetical protein